jgi:hypothetical protein
MFSYPGGDVSSNTLAQRRVKTCFVKAIMYYVCTSSLQLLFLTPAYFHITPSMERTAGVLLQER